MLAGLWPSVAATGRILDATGRELVPTGLDFEALRADLFQCRRDTLGKQIDTAQYRKSYKKGAQVIADRARALGALLKSSGNRLLDERLWVDLDPEHHELPRVLVSLAHKAEHIGKQSIDVVHDGGHKAYLVGLLGPIYQRHFKRQPGRTHDGSGPFPRFVEAVSCEMGGSIRVSKHTVHKSLATKRRDVGKT
jgi:hypothetical protein